MNLKWPIIIMTICMKKKCRISVLPEENTKVSPVREKTFCDTLPFRNTLNVISFLAEGSLWGSPKKMVKVGNSDQLADPLPVSWNTKKRIAKLSIHHPLFPCSIPLFVLPSRIGNISTHLHVYDVLDHTNNIFYVRQ